VPGTKRLSGITGSNPATFTYDANGRIISNGQYTFVYNQANRLSQVKQSATLIADRRSCARNQCHLLFKEGSCDYYTLSKPKAKRGQVSAFDTNYRL